jgi:hypothetical protein
MAGVLQSLASLVAWVAGLWMVFKLFQKKGVLHGILGLVCELYPFIWGLMNFSDPEIKKPMTIWLVAIGVSIVLGIISAVVGSGASGSSFLPLFM